MRPWKVIHECRGVVMGSSGEKPKKNLFGPVCDRR